MQSPPSGRDQTCMRFSPLFLNSLEIKAHTVYLPYCLRYLHVNFDSDARATWDSEHFNILPFQSYFSLTKNVLTKGGHFTFHHLPIYTILACILLEVSASSSHFIAI